MSRHAFTLVELIVVLVIISAVAGLALPAYGSALARYRLDAAAFALSRELDRATSHARATSTTVSIRFDTATHVVEFNGLPDRRTNATSFTLDLRESPREARIVSADFASTQTYQISGFGIPSSEGGVTLTNGGMQRSIKVDAATGL